MRILIVRPCRILRYESLLLQFIRVWGLWRFGSLGYEYGSGEQDMTLIPWLLLKEDTYTIIQGIS